MRSVLKTEELCVGYGKKEIVSGISQEIIKGQFVSILGPNGSGKTTILKTLAKIIAPLRGRIYINGLLLDSLSSKEVAKNLSVVLTERPSSGLLTAFEFVSLGRYPYTDIFGRLTEKDKEKIKETLQLVNAEELSERYFGELSDGEKQKLIIARAIAQEPEIIILDEPTIHLDPKNKIEVLSILYRLSKKKGVTVLVSLHDIDVASRISDLVLLVKEGRIIDFGPPEKVINQERIAQLYDLKDVHFNSKLYTFELLKNNKRKDIFVIAGAGTGTPLYRMLLRHGFGIITGIIHENDIDFHVANSMKLEVIAERAFQKIGKNTLKKAFSFIDHAKAVIDSGFPVGSFNRENIDLIYYAIKKEKKAYTLRKKEEAYELYGNLSKKLIYLNDFYSFLEIK